MACNLDGFHSSLYVQGQESEFSKAVLVNLQRVFENFLPGW